MAGGCVAYHAASMRQGMVDEPSYGESRDTFIRGGRSSKDVSYEALGLARGNSRIQH